VTGGAAMTTRRRLLALGTAIAVAASVGVPLSAAADPPPQAARTYAGVGSPTSADLWTALANGHPGLANGRPTVPGVASYDATGSASITIRAGGTPIPRPSSTVEGIESLLAHPDSVDFARSSTRPVNDAGMYFDTITYLPIARDAVSMVGFRLDSDVIDFSRQELTALYSCTSAGRIVVSGAGAAAVIRYVSPAAPGRGAADQRLYPVLPGGSGDVRAFFMRGIGLTEPGACVAGSPSTPENDGRVVDRPGEVVPFLVSSWIAQLHNMTPAARTVTPYDHSITGINGARPVADSNDAMLPPIMPGPIYGRGAYPPGMHQGVFSRDVYIVVRTAALSTGIEEELTAALATGTARMVVNRAGFKNIDYLGRPRWFIGAAWPE
jgi:hypothetical protein